MMISALPHQRNLDMTAYTDEMPESQNERNLLAKGCEWF
jgi:hypothetical protein